jgi:glutaredoxin
MATKRPCRESSSSQADGASRNMKSHPQAKPHGSRVVLYTRQGCHLCEEALGLLQKHGLRPDCVDVDLDPELCERFNASVPVVEIDGQIRFRGRVDPRLLRRLLASRD